jgi:multiple sugar transport system permease protein
MDGASPWSVFLHIQIPALIPQIKTNSVIALITGINLFPQILVTTQGGPGYRTFTAGYYIYWLGSENDRQGYASAIAFVVFAILVLVAAVQATLLQRRETSL